MAWLLKWLGRKPDQVPIVDHDLSRLAEGVGQVTISASMLEWALAYVSCLIDGWNDAKLREVMSSPGRPLREYRNLVPRLEAFGLGPDVAQIADDAGKLLAQRNRVVHSVMMAEVRATNETLYEAWHARSDETWPAVSDHLNTLARDLMLCAVEANAFANAWTARAERDGWPVLPMAGQSAAEGG